MRWAIPGSASRSEERRVGNDCDWSQTCALPIFIRRHGELLPEIPVVTRNSTFIAGDLTMKNDLAVGLPILLRRQDSQSVIRRLVGVHEILVLDALGHTWISLQIGRASCRE